MEWAVRIGWAILALIHATPALALFRPALISKLYGVSKGSPLFLLLHHRAALFFIILILCIWAMVALDVRRVAVVAVGLSMLSFLWLYMQAGAPPALKTIALADLIGIPALAFVGWRAFISG